MIAQVETAKKPLDASTTLAVDRTRLAYERTLMAWIRTATSLITFGFTIYKFFQIELAREGPRTNRLIGPREFALLMIVIGLVSLLMATLEHRRDLKFPIKKVELRNTGSDPLQTISMLQDRRLILLIRTIYFQSLWK